MLFAFVGMFALVVTAAKPVFAQEPEIDSSKPTNFYPSSEAAVHSTSATPGATSWGSALSQRNTLG